MNKFIFIFICLISTLLCSTYLPFKKDKDFDIEGLCLYGKNSIYYVKPCEEGKYCEYKENNLGICSAIPNKTTLQSEGETCENDFECEDGLYCKSSKCSIDSSSDCGNNQSPYLTYNYYTKKNTWACKETKYLDYCYYRDLTLQSGDFTESSSSPSLEYSYNPLKVCGKMEIKKRTVTNVGDIYAIQSIQSTYIGTLKDGEWVYDERACESGYALYFYGDGTLVDPAPNYSGDDRHSMFKKCVTPKSIYKTSSTNCVITYDDDKKYNVYQRSLRNRRTITINGNYNPSFEYDSISSSTLCDDNLLKKLEMFKKYTAVFTEEKQKECEKNKYYDEPETCRDNELRKLYFYYENPEFYELYYDEDGKNNDVINYLIQGKYQSYQSSGFLSFKYFISILLFLIIF